MLKIINKLHLDCSLTTNHTMNEGKEEAYDALIYQERELGRKMTGPELKVHDESLGLELGLS